MVYTLANKYNYPFLKRMTYEKVRKITWEEGRV
jgi:hypothetical protein